MDKSLVDRAQKYLFASVEEMEQASLTSVMRARIDRLREMYTYWLQNPRLVDKDIVDQLQQRHQIGLSQAYEDVRVLKVCLGNLGRLTKDYDRYLFRLRCEEGWGMTRALRCKSLRSRNGRLPQRHPARQRRLSRPRLQRNSPADVHHHGRPNGSRVHPRPRHIGEGQETRSKIFTRDRT